MCHLINECIYWEGISGQGDCWSVAMCSQHASIASLGTRPNELLSIYWTNSCQAHGYGFGHTTLFFLLWTYFALVWQGLQINKPSMLLRNHYLFIYMIPRKHQRDNMRQMHWWVANNEVWRVTNKETTQGSIVFWSEAGRKIIQEAKAHRSTALYILNNSTGPCPQALSVLPWQRMAGVSWTGPSSWPKPRIQLNNHCQKIRLGQP